MIREINIKGEIWEVDMNITTPIVRNKLTGKIKELSIEESDHWRNVYYGR